MKTYTVEIRGLTPLLQNRFTESNEQQKSTRAAVVSMKDPRKEAELAAHKLPSEDGFFIPSQAIFRLIRESASHHKIRGTRRSAKYSIPGAVRMPDEIIPIIDENGSNIQTFEIDARPVVIPATKGRIMKYRPRFNQWGAKFNICVNTDILDAEFIHQLIQEGGYANGLGDFRPQTSGPFGTFQVVSWKQI